MAILKERNLRVTSQAFELLRDKEKRDGKRISIDAVSRETGLAKMTVRRFVTKEEGGGAQDVSGSPLVAAAVMADYFGVPLTELLTVEHTTLEAAE